MAPTLASGLKVDEMLIKSGVYIIQSLIDHTVYVGSAINFIRRKSRHFTLLKEGRHHNDHLQNAWNKYKEEVNIK